MKKPIIYLSIIFLVAVCSFVGGYFIYSINDKSPNNRNYLKEEKLDSISETTNKTSSTKDKEEKEIESKKSSKESSKNSQSSKKTSTSSAKETSKKEVKKVYLDVYYSETCGYCKSLLQFLNSLDNKSQMVIKKHEVTTNYSDFENAVKKYGNNPGYGVPYVIFNNDIALTGYSKDLENEYISYINKYLG